MKYFLKFIFFLVFTFAIFASEKNNNSLLKTAVLYPKSAFVNNSFKKTIFLNLNILEEIIKNGGFKSKLALKIIEILFNKPDLVNNVPKNVKPSKLSLINNDYKPDDKPSNIILSGIVSEILKSNNATQKTKKTNDILLRELKDATLNKILICSGYQSKDGQGEIYLGNGELDGKTDLIVTNLQKLGIPVSVEYDIKYDGHYITGKHEEFNLITYYIGVPTIFYDKVFQFIEHLKKFKPNLNLNQTYSSFFNNEYFLNLCLKEIWNFEGEIDPVFYKIYRIASQNGIDFSLKLLYQHFLERRSIFLELDSKNDEKELVKTINAYLNENSAKLNGSISENILQLLSKNNISISPEILQEIVKSEEQLHKHGNSSDAEYEKIFLYDEKPFYYDPYDDDKIKFLIKMPPTIQNIITDSPLVSGFQNIFNSNHIYIENNYGIKTLVVPAQLASIIKYLLKNGIENQFEKQIASKYSYNEEFLINEIRSLGMNNTSINNLGNKEKSFIIFEKLKLNYPKGIVISEKLIQRMIEHYQRLDYQILEHYIRDILSKMSSNSFVLHIRSNPRISMPGILTSIKSSKEYSNPRSNDDFIDNFFKVAYSWFSEKAIEFRKLYKISDEYLMSIIIQESVETNNIFASTNDENKLYASGVFSTHNPNSGEEEMYGVYLKNKSGDNLMTGDERGIEISNLKGEYPDVYEQLNNAKTLLENELGPQEVEFAVEAGKVFFLQTRDLTFTPQGEIKYIQNKMKKDNVMLVNTILKISSIQEKTQNRKLYKIKTALRLKSIGKGIASTSGAFKGKLVWSSKLATQLIQNNEPIIFVSNKENKEEILRFIFTYKNCALITLHGNGSSHEAVLTRKAGIPSLINLNHTQYFSENIVLENDYKLKEGDMVVIDANNNSLIITDENVLEEDGFVNDASFGINLRQFENDFIEPYLYKNGVIRKEFTASILEELNKKALLKFERLEKEGSEKEIFIANFEKHFIHKLWLRKLQEEQATKDYESILLGNLFDAISLIDNSVNFIELNRRITQPINEIQDLINIFFEFFNNDKIINLPELEEYIIFKIGSLLLDPAYLIKYSDIFNSNICAIERAV
ncbi:MAG: hypothetical protein ACD_79C00235G0004 [uncultured bacterium]|nr:MAG: hypothetical protein ACD_79C00235G0004 [uncultured bacterium]